MSSPSIKITGDKEVNKRLSNLRRYVITATGLPASYVVSARAVETARKLAQTWYHSPPNKPNYPLRWKSKKQRIAVIIKLKESGNLPYQRTGRFDTEWNSEVTGNQITISNDAKDPSTGRFYAPFLIGTFQQPFHKDTGYVKRTVTLEKDITMPIRNDIYKQTLKGIEASKNG